MGAALCPVPMELRPGLYAFTRGPSGGIYDGAATVERSTAGDLVLYFEVPAEAGGGMAPMHMSITAKQPLPVLPLGALLWLQKDPAGEPVYKDFQLPTPGQAFSARDRQGGKLLLGMAVDSSSAAAPIEIGQLTDGCVEHNGSCMAEDALRIHQNVELLGDEPVTLADGESGSVMLDGVDYSARVSALRTTTGGGGCFESSDHDYLAVQLLAKQPELVTADLELGEPPACGDGNDPAVDTSLALYNVSGETFFTGPVFYSGPDFEIRPGSFRFDVPGLEDVSNGPPFLSLLTTPGTFTPPVPQTELWLDMPDLNVQALRESEAGPLMLATVHGMRAEPGSEPERTALIERVLGLQVGSQKRCDYVVLPEVTDALWDLVLEADQQVIAKTGERTPFTLGGKSYEVYVNGYSSVSFSIYLAP